VALDAAHERGPAALDGVAARTVLPLAARHVGAEVPRGELPERHTRRLDVGLLPARRHDAQARDDEVGATAQLLEHQLGLLGPRRLAEDAAVDDDRGVDAEHGARIRLTRDRTRLPHGVLADEADG